MKNNDKSDFKPIYIHWYEDDFQADLAVRRMSSRQRAFFRNLLMYCYYGKQRPYLTANDDELWMIADADSKEEWLANKALIMSKFKPLNGSGTLLSNKRVLEEWQIIEGWLAQKQKAGLASAAARRRNGHSDDVSFLSESDTQCLAVHHATPEPNARSTTVQQPVDSPLTGSQEPPKSFSTYEDEHEDEDEKEKHLCANEGGSHDSVADSEEENPQRQQWQQMIAAVQRVWDYYVQKMRKNPHLLTFNEDRKRKGLARLREAMKKLGGDVGKAEQLLKIAVDALAGSKFHMGQNEQKKAYNSWEKNLFPSNNRFERWLEES